MNITTLREKLDLTNAYPWNTKECDEGSIARRIILDLTMALGVAPVACRHSLYLYDDAGGVWVELDQDLFHALVQAYAADVPVEVNELKKDKDGNDRWETRQQPLKITHNKIRGVYQLALRFPDIYKPEFFDRPEQGIAFANGFVKVTDYGIELRPHAAQHRSLAAMPYDYSDAAECPEWLAVLRRVFAGDPDITSKMAALQEFTGACVCGIAADYQRCMVMVGGGENGKSTIAETISESLFPGELVTHVPPQDWDKEYNLSHLKNAKLNMASEIPESEILASAAFKGVVTGDPCTARDPYQKPFSFRPVAGHLFSCNSLPSSRDSSYGFWRRFLVLTFNRDFGRDPDKTTKSGLRSLLDAEADGIMLWALHGAVRLLKRREYTLPTSHADALTEWQTDVNPVAAFVADCCDINGGAEWTALADIHAEFKSWCERQGSKGLKNKTLARRLRDAGVLSEKGRTGIRFHMAVLPRIDWKDWNTTH